MDNLFLSTWGTPFYADQILIKDQAFMYLLYFSRIGHIASIKKPRREGQDTQAPPLPQAKGAPLYKLTTNIEALPLLNTLTDVAPCSHPLMLVTRSYSPKDGVNQNGERGAKEG